ncbi:MAG TPA: permease, partial [Aldersonia sp.]
MTTAQAPAAPKPNWVRRIVLVLCGIAAVIVTYLILASFVPRWWAQRAAALSDASFARGTAWGLFFGIVCTLVPLLLVLLAVLVFKREKLRGWLAGIAVVVALLVALPNLMTLSVVLGTNSAAHAGERVMDVEAPGFRAGSLWGAIIG